LNENDRETSQEAFLAPLLQYRIRINIIQTVSDAFPIQNGV